MTGSITGPITGLLPALLPLVPFSGAVIAAAVAVVAPRAAQRLAAAAMALTTAMAGWGLWRSVTEAPLTHPVGGWAAPLGIEYVLDPLSGVVALLVAVIGLLVILYPSEVGLGTAVTRGLQVYPLMLLLLGALMGVTVAGDLFNLFVSLEIYSIASYALIALGGPAAAVASFRYLLLGTVGSSLYLLGVGFVYFTTGTLSMSTVAAALSDLTDSPTTAAAVGLILIGLGIKMALFPLHGWLPDAHSHAPPGVAALLAAVQVKVAAYALIRIIFEVFPVDYVTGQIPVTTILTWFGAAGILVGSVMAVRQEDIKRMLAHSTVAQLGYIAIGIGLGTPLALVGALMHMVAHGAMKASLFFVVGGVLHTAGVKRITQYAGLGATMPWPMAGFTVAAISMVGLPPTVGFVSKWYLVSGALEARQWVVAAVVVAASVVTLTYFLRLLELIWFTPPSADLPVPAREIRPPGPGVMFPVVVLSIVIAVLGVASRPVVREVLEPVARRLLG